MKKVMFKQRLVSSKSSKSLRGFRVIMIFIFSFLFNSSCHTSSIDNDVRKFQSLDTMEIDTTIGLPKNNNSTITDSIKKLDDSANVFINQIMCFKKIKEKQIELGKNPLQFYLRDTFNEPEKYYWIQVGYDNGIRVEVVYNFYCYPKSNKIYFLNTSNDKTILVKNGNWNSGTYGKK